LVLNYIPKSILKYLNRKIADRDNGIFIPQCKLQTDNQLFTL